MRYTPRLLAGLGLGIIGILTVVGGILLGGGPGYARKEARDQRRSEGLNQIQNELNSLYISRGHLASASEYEAFFIPASTTIIRFPDGHPFAETLPRYTIKNEDTYELCSSFETDTRRERYGVTRPSFPQESPDFWYHVAGDTCYTVQITALTKDEALRHGAYTSTSTRP